MAINFYEKKKNKAADFINDKLLLVQNKNPKKMARSVHKANFNEEVQDFITLLNRVYAVLEHDMAFLPSAFLQRNLLCSGCRMLEKNVNSNGRERTRYNVSVSALQWQLLALHYFFSTILAPIHWKTTQIYLR
ncbi:hypothetical protein SUGI_0727920 [Cryptomeria japonica]|nr:hypothetical protein SUGI_0727920 [Cryptomeria japonica]